ncbi:hypothetical protein ADIS_0105 [Lunatimonas lonarensis]|uniref:Uncharacterized protein n=1 Tax=Lunatimonas lonarensis TaxID=1232681 RepID=R7ZZ94_9BACT|nr:hypothetical protein [Lunatimonas lonarensis]EON79415.1 hypothetical protein ADIS_0105 [Lunatimonas lonarensis]
MTDDEFDLLDELYFLQSYEYLKETLGWEHSRLVATLDLLYAKEFVKCYSAPDTEVFGEVNLERDGHRFYYLATKMGLLKHNAL